MEIDLAKLGRFITEHFELYQLRALCEELDVPYQQLLGHTRRAKSFDLVTLMRDQGQLSVLLAAVSRARPDLFDPQDFIVGRRRDKRRERRLFLLGLVGGLTSVLLVGTVFLLTQRPRPAPAPSATPVTSTPLPRNATATTPPTQAPVATLPSSLPSPSPTVLSPTPSSIPATPTASPSPSATPRATATRTPLPTPPPSATHTSTPLPSPTLTLSPLSPAWTYDAATRTLILAPGDASLGRARLCTPLNAYQSDQVIHLIDSIVKSLGLSLPAQARITHTYPGHLVNGPIVRTLEVQRHPMTGVKVTGEKADFTGCDLTVSPNLRPLLGFPADLGEFSAPPRFDHGWVTIEFLAVP